MGLYDELQDIMMKYHFRPQKKLSQFFCINEALLRFLVKTAELNSKDIVLEIGPGTGFLTKILLEKTKVIAVERDELMIELLSAEFKKEISEGKLVLINDDSLEINFDETKATKIVSLPPYHISSELLTKIVLSKIKKAVLVLDTGFINKATAFEGMKEYNALTAFLNLNAKVEVLEIIDKQSFFPTPNCQSAVLSVDFNRKNSSKEYLLFLKEIFRHKNKDLARALNQAIPFIEKELGWGKKEIKKFGSLKLSTTKVYSLSPQELLKVFEEIEK